MYYKPPEDQKETKEKEYYTSQENAFIKYITQVDAIPNIVENDFLKKYRRRILFSGKIKGLSFITNPQTIQLNACMRNNISLAEDAGLDELADETVFDNIDICQTTRGTNGNLQYALITQRKEFQDKSEQHKKSAWSKIFRRKEDVDNAQYVVQGA